MTIDFGVVLYIENAVLTAGVVLAWIHRDGHTIMAFKDETDAPPPLLFLLLAAVLWPLAWLAAGVGLVALAISRLGRANKAA